MKKCLCLLVAVISALAITKTAYATGSNEELPSALKYSEIESAIDAYVMENEKTTAAVSIAVYTSDEVLFQKAYGYTDIQNKITNDSEAVFEWGSCTKLLVWTSAMQLVEKGKLDLNQDIRSYLPEDFFSKLKYDKPISMLNLMNHNAGWQETITDLFLKDTDDIKELGDALRYIEPEQVNEPGEVVAYSNWGTALAGYIVECVSGQSFDDYIHEHIFEPLGMEHTAISADLSDNAWVLEQRTKQICYTTSNVSLGNSLYYLSLYPAGMATGTISDFVKFAQIFSNTDDKTSPLFENMDTLKEMLSPSLYFADGETARNYHGFWTDEFSIPVLWHDGGTNGSTSWFAFDPETGTGVVILTNQKGESVYTCGVLPKIFGSYQYDAKVENSQDISGMYVSSRTCFQGYAKLYSMLCLMEVAPDIENGGYYTPETNNTFVSISKNSYVIDMGGLKQFTIFQNTNGKGEKVLQMPGTDYIEINGYGVIAKLVLLILFVIAALFSIIALLIRLVSLLRRNKKKRVLTSYLTVVNSSVILSLILFVYIAVTLFSSAAMYETLQWSIILNAICALVPVTYMIRLIITWKNIDCSKKMKAELILNGIAGLIMTLNVVFWNTYKFW